MKTPTEKTLHPLPIPLDTIKNIKAKIEEPKLQSTIDQELYQKPCGHGCQQTQDPI